MQNEYTYKGDRFTDLALINQSCSAVRRPDGKCITAGRKVAMLVEFDGKKVIVNRRLLRKIKA